MKKITGDLWTVESEVKVIPTNGMYTRISDGVYRAHMGAGLARQAALKWPSLPLKLGIRLFGHGNRLYVFQVPPALRSAVLCSVLVTFPTKHDWHDPSLLTLIDHSARQLHQAQVQNGWESVLLPKVGCGLGGQAWEDVEPVLDQHLDQRFTIITNER